MDFQSLFEKEYEFQEFELSMQLEKTNLHPIQCQKGFLIL